MLDIIFVNPLLIVNFSVVSIMKVIDRYMQKVNHSYKNNWGRIQSQEQKTEEKSGHNNEDN